MPPSSPYTFADLKAELRKSLFPTGEAATLVDPHNQMFKEAMVNIAQYVECLQVNNIQVFPRCDTLFKCGMTVIDKPRGRLNELYVIDKINQDTGLEDGDVADDWCSRIDYRPVDFADLERFVSQSLVCAGEGDDILSWVSRLNQSILSQMALPGLRWNKYTFPPPDDEGLDKAPPLPTGFHYAQTSTDAPSRSRWGMWAIKGGQIYIAPWIQSTETVIVEWDGIKRIWNDVDLVDDDPMLKQAVEAYVLMEHERKYGHDMQIMADAERKYNDAKSNLMYECRMEQQQRASDENVSQARGASLIVPTWTNDPQTATATCQAGYTGNQVTYTVPAGTVVSRTSQADANSRAQSLALQTAGAQLDCTVIPVTYPNTEQSFTANCVNATGLPVTRTVLAGTILSEVSQADADAQALAQATSEAIAALECTYFNTEQTYTATCPEGTSGSSVTKTIPAGAYSSVHSQSDADQLALNQATFEATDELVCTDTTVYYNTQQFYTKTAYCRKGDGSFVLLSASATVDAGRFNGVTQAAANAQAYAEAFRLASLNWQFECRG